MAVKDQVVTDVVLKVFLQTMPGICALRTESRACRVKCKADGAFVSSELYRIYLHTLLDAMDSD